MRGILVGVVCVVGVVGTARADDRVQHVQTLAVRWPAPPPATGLPLDQKMIDHMSDLGNQATAQIQHLSGDRLALHIDGRHQRAHLRLTAGPRRYLSLRMDEDILFTSGRARIATRIDLTLHGHDLQFGLPDVEMSPASYKDESGVAIELPLFERRW